MKDIKQRLLTGWSFRRILFVFAGSLLIVQGIIDKQWLGILVGAYFAFNGFAALGCAGISCSTDQCTADTKKDKVSSVEKNL